MHFTDVPDFSVMHQKKDDETLLSDILQLQDSCNFNYGILLKSVLMLVY